MNSTELLDVISIWWHQDALKIKDSIHTHLYLGNRMNEYLLLAMKETFLSDPTSKAKPRSVRRTAIEALASSLKIDPSRVGAVIAISVVYDILVSGLQISCIKASFGAISPFAKLIERDLKVSEHKWEEKWVFKRGIDSTQAKRLFHQCLTEGWGRPEVIKRLENILPRKRRVHANNQSGQLPSFIGLARVASPKDLADMVVSLIQQSSDPKLVKSLVDQGIIVNSLSAL